MKYESLISGNYYHIYNQGNNGENIFLELRNYAYFLGLLKKYVVPISEIYAYCLLPNHFHLLVRIHEDLEVGNSAAQAFSKLFNAYAKAINKSYNRSGSLFKRKFSRIKIDNEDYVKKLVLYIHTNPKHHGIMSDFQRYKHSSYKAYLSNKTTNVSKDYILSLFEDLDNFVASHYMKAEQIDASFSAYMLE